MDEHHDVIIVGGGLAGLGAAKTLCENGSFSVILLEADSTIGGRVKTDYLPDGTPVPLGATSFHGKKGNSLLEFAKAEGLTGSAEVLIEEDSVFHTFSGGQEVPSETVQEVEDKVLDIMDEIDDCCKSGDWSLFGGSESKDCLGNSADPPNIDVRDFIVLKITPFLQSKRIPFSVMDGVLAYEGITEGCKGLHNIDLGTYGIWAYSDENTDVIYQDNPFHKVVNCLASKIPAGVIHTNKEVFSIEFDTRYLQYQQSDINRTSGTALAGLVRVKCKDGSNYKARHLIYTCSLGVLKNACTSNVFAPPLPPKKVAAIQELGFSLVNKVFLQFDGPLLSGKYEQFRLYWSEKDFVNPLVTTNKWILGLQFFRLLPNEQGKFIYHTFFVQEDAFAVEQLQDKEVADVILDALSHFLCQKLPNLLAVKVTRWSSVYTCGSYSYNPHGTIMDKREELSKPVGFSAPLQVLFAGEATSIDQFGCSHSAFDTGVREAERLIVYSNQAN